MYGVWHETWDEEDTGEVMVHTLDLCKHGISKISCYHQPDTGYLCSLKLTMSSGKVFPFGRVNENAKKTEYNGRYNNQELAFLGGGRYNAGIRIGFHWI